MSKRDMLSDDAARSAALDVSRSFIVQAPAGSGKTELLIQRYLALLARVERPEAIVAMTFTRKAAGEIRERVIAALRDAVTEVVPVETHAATTWRLARSVLQRDAALEWNLIAHPARLQVLTIDALCASLMRRAPLATKVGMSPRFVERAESLYVEAARSELEIAGADSSAWQRLLEHLDNDADRLVDLIAGMLGKRDQWLDFLIVDDKEAMRAHLESALRAEIDRELSQLDAAFPRELMAPLLELASHAAANLRHSDPTHPLVAHSQDDWLGDARGSSRAHSQGELWPGSSSRWPSIADWLLRKGEATFLTKMDKRQGFLSVSGARVPERRARGDRKRSIEALLATLQQAPGLAAALDSARLLPPPRYDDASWSFITALLDVLRLVLARLQLVFARENAIDYPESTIIALRALSSDEGPSDLLLALDMRMEHLLLDEFQDTSLAQHELIERLTEGWSSGDGRTLFIVGDPMQSIFGFREADVGLFLGAQKNRRIGSVELEPLTLARNFRSRKGLVDWVNTAFSGVFSSSTDPAHDSIAFSPSIATRDIDRELAVTVDLCVDARHEAATVLSRVRAALAGPAETVAVLVRKRTDLDELLPALRANGIAFSAIELDSLSERQIILDLCALTHALVQPDDRLAWLAALRAPWCGLTLADLFVVSGGCGNRALGDALAGDVRSDIQARLSAEGSARFGRFADIATSVVAERGRLPLATAVRGAWVALGGPACVGDPVDLEAADRFFALLTEHQVGADIPDWARFVDELGALRAEAQPDPTTRVRIMTLHRAKGLEFDIVIMPGLTRKGGSGARDPLIWRRRSDRILLGPMKSRYLAPGENDAVYAYLGRIALAEERAELGRLLYVGCTRARERLHLTSTLRTKDGDQGARRWRDPPAHTALGALWPAISACASAPVPTADAGAKAGSEKSGVPLLRLSSRWQLPEPPPAITHGDAIESLSDRDSVEFDWARETARRVGTLAHRLLRQLADEGINHWTAPRIAVERRRIAREFAGLGLTADEIDPAVEQVLTAISATVAEPRGRWLFDPGHGEAVSEYAVTGSRQGKFVHVVLDRTFVDSSGIRWIVDFKLSRHEGSGVPAFLDREQERYRGQMENYAAVMRDMDPRPIRLALYFPLVPGWREWESGF